jgi:hypothetical protein
MTRAWLTLSLLLIALNVNAAEFDETKAWNNLLSQVAFGPRDPGSQGHQKCLVWLEGELKKYTAKVERQPFMGREGLSGRSVPLTNLIAYFPGKIPTQDRVLLCAHWDTRPWADLDPDPLNRKKPILGANDGASGVAVLLEIARCLALKQADVSVEIVLFDGEDLGRQKHLEEYLQGSQEYARNLKLPLPQAGLLLDMVGDKDLHITQEQYSLYHARTLVQQVFAVAARLNLPAFDPYPGDPVYDDHIPLLEAGIPVVNLIDFNYPYWHTLQDTPENCSEQSLDAVGKVVLEWVYQR